MLARLHSVTLEGIEGVICEVEVDVGRHGFEKSIIVGLPDAAVKESIERVRSKGQYRLRSSTAVSSIQGHNH